MILMCIWLRWMKTWENCGYKGLMCIMGMSSRPSSCMQWFFAINDFPSYGNLSGYSVKGHHTCPICEKDKSYIQLKHGKKAVYTRHQWFPKHYHLYRWMKKAFNGTLEIDSAPKPLAGHEVFNRVKDIITIFRKTQKKDGSDKNIWKKSSIFFDLPY